MSKCIWMVDDQANRPTVERLQMVGTKQDTVEVKNYCGTGKTELFAKDVAKHSISPQDYFILDCFMPVPLVIKLGKFWNGQAVDARYCGFALAKWLCETKSINQNNIILCSAFQDFAQRKADFGLGSELECWDGWQSMTVLRLRKWLQI
ncbi:hypothetical protein V8J88_07790 [Massilia sp. W12]|uniref:hypothetical protein n=1 Tax=Massilia sp. W12 TaxID=3126507 RepID=UPI0030D43065